MPPVPFEQLTSSLAFWLPYIVIASICLAAGLAALGLAALGSHDRLLLRIGVFATLYGLRLFCENDLIRIALGVPSLHMAVVVITYVIPIPYVLFFRELFGRGWKSSIEIWLRVQLVFAPVAILADLVAGYSSATDLVNSLLIVAGTALVLVPLLIRGGPSVPGVVRWSITLFLLISLANNFHLRIAGRNPEPFGFLLLIGGLVTSAVMRALSRDRKLAEVEGELATARRIQTSILPRAMPDVPKLRVTAAYHPMTSVAGDFYDFLRTDEHRVTILVADVSGHGVPAALIASMVKVAFAMQRDTATDPAAILFRLNGILHGVLESQFVTAACAHIDLQANTITYAGAGHPPAIVTRANSSEAETLAENGLFLGPFGFAKYTNTQTSFGPGDRLLLYTDGIVEATLPDGEPFGEERLLNFAVSRRSAQPASFVDELLASISAGEQEDDLTVVLAEAL